MVDRKWDVKKDNEPMIVPSFETISFSLPSMDNWESYLSGKQDGWCYLSDGNPTLSALEKLLAQNQGVEACWVTSTGKSAIAMTLMALLNAGDEVIILREGYKSTRLFAEGALKRFGVKVTIVGIDEMGKLADIITPGATRVLVLESPTNPMTRVLDLKAAVSVAKEHGVMTVLDNSCAGFHQHGDVPVDVFCHSLSKFASGVGDVMGGAVLGSKEWVSRVKSANVWNSDVLSSHSALEIWKGMQTYDLRVSRQSSNALALAQFLEQHEGVSRVLYPGLSSHPDYEVAKTQMSDYGSVLAFDVRGGEAAMRAVLDKMSVFRMAFGTGFTQSIANPAWLFYARSFPEAEQGGPGAILDNTIRLSVGIEPTEVLIEDIAQALQAVAACETVLAAGK